MPQQEIESRIGASEARMEFGGFVGGRIAANLEQWQLPALSARPGMVLALFGRDRKFPEDLIVYVSSTDSGIRSLKPWAGAYPGQHLTASVLHYRLTHDDRLRGSIEEMVDLLHSMQDADGYLGPWPSYRRLTGTIQYETTIYEYPQMVTKEIEVPLWDIWGHYHCMLGLIMWYDESGNPRAFDVAKRIADCICRRFPGVGDMVSSAGAVAANQAIAHGFCLLYERTGEQRYLDMVERIVKDWETSGAGDYLWTALSGREFFETPKPRWESLHDVQALAELYHITGREDYRGAFEHIWWSLLKGDRHNTGGFSSEELAELSPDDLTALEDYGIYTYPHIDKNTDRQSAIPRYTYATIDPYDQSAIETYAHIRGNPYHPGWIDICATVAWSALCVDMLRLSGLSIAADELELTLFNGVIGSQSPSGRWWTHNTPMDGIKRAAGHWVIPSPDLDCCSVNAPRGLGILSDWAVLRSEAGVWINYYGPCRVETSTPSGARLNLIQETAYPAGSSIHIQVSPLTPEEFPIYVRIPAWSKNTRVYVNGREVSKVTPGEYLILNRLWKQGDSVEIELDMRPHFWAGERECEGKVSIYRGPILLTFDPTFNDDIDIAEIPEIDIRSVELRPADTERVPKLVRPWMLFEAKAADGRKVYLSDFASSGWGGMPYRTWIPCKGGEPQEFSRANPLRSYRPKQEQ